VTRVVVRIEYADGAFRQFSALWPAPCLLIPGMTEEEAGLSPGMRNPDRKEPLIGLVFGGNPQAGGVQVHQEGVL
jgi:hypothetical protein